MTLALLSVIKAVIARLILVIHALLAVWRAVVLKDNTYWLLLLILIGVIVDAGIVLIKRKGEEWKWFSPTVFFYLCTACPAIWLLELKRLATKKVETTTKGTSENSSTKVIGLDLDADQWVLFIEQAMLLLLIITRWLMPKGEMTHDQLSQLLLVYLGLAADIVELFAIFEEPGILNNQAFIFCILAAWSWSLLQFTLVLTATRARGFKVTPQGEAAETEPNPYRGCFCCESEVWSILIMIILLDLPFLALRLVAIAYFGVSTYTIYFFTCKNMLVVVLQFYRLTVVCVTHHREEEKRMTPRSETVETDLSCPVGEQGTRNVSPTPPSGEYGAIGHPNMYDDPHSSSRSKPHLRQ